MGMDPLVSWLAWWAMRGKHLSTLSTADAEHLHLGYFLREAEIWWRRSGAAVRAYFKPDTDALESRGKALAQELHAWWSKETASIVNDCQKFVREFGANSAPSGSETVQAIQRGFEAAIGQPDWIKHIAWSNTGVWAREVDAAIQAFGRAPLELPPNCTLPFDTLALPQFARSDRFIVGAMAAGLGVAGKLGKQEAELEAELLKAAATADGPVAGAVAFSLTVVAGRLAAKLPRMFHEFCMDLAASAAPAVRVLDLLFTTPSAMRPRQAAEWMMFTAWDWSALGGGIRDIPGHSPNAAEFESRDGIAGWLRHGGLLSSKDAHPLAAMAGAAMNALSLHVTNGGFAAFGLAAQQGAEKQPEGAGHSAPAADISAKIGAPAKNGHQVNVSLEIGGTTREVKARVAELVEQLGESGKASAVDNRTLADLVAAFPALDSLLNKAKSGLRGKTNVEAPALKGRVAKH